MKHLFASSRVTFFFLCVVALFVLVAEYERYIRGRAIRSLPHHSPPSFMYHNYCVHFDVVEPLLTDFDRIAQILHVSADLLDEKVVEQITNWNGPVSMTVVLRSIHQYQCTHDFLQRIRRESVSVARNLRAHLVFAKQWSADCSLSDVVQSNVSMCEKRGQTSLEQIAQYPANIARNVARIFSSTKYIVITDYEHLFSEGFEEKVRAVAEKRLSEKPQTMLVYRIFEINEEVEELPRNKSDLHKLYLSKKAVVFHSVYYPGAHDIDGLSEWFAKNESEDGLFAKEQKYDRSNWEPQFVSHAQIPFHDENFPFQIRDNTVLRWEMCRANYTIDILDDVFMFHKGIKKWNNSKALAIQKQNFDKFQDALKAFKERMDREYPKTKRRCPTPKR